MLLERCLRNFVLLYLPAVTVWEDESQLVLAMLDQ